MLKNTVSSRLQRFVRLLALVAPLIIHTIANQSTAPASPLPENNGPTSVGQASASGDSGIDYTEIAANRLRVWSAWSALDVHSGYDGFTPKSPLQHGNTKILPASTIADEFMRQFSGSFSSLAGLKLLFVLPHVSSDVSVPLLSSAVLSSFRGAESHVFRTHNNKNAQVMGSGGMLYDDDAEELLDYAGNEAEAAQWALLSAAGVHVHAVALPPVSTLSANAYPSFAHALLMHLNDSAMPQYDVVIAPERQGSVHQAMLAQRQGWLQNNMDAKFAVGLFGGQQYSDTLSWHVQDHHDYVTLYHVERRTVEYAHLVWTHHREIADKYTAWGFKLPKVVWLVGLPDLSALITGGNSKLSQCMQQGHRLRMAPEQLHLAFVGDPTRATGFHMLMDAIDMVLSTASEAVQVQLDVLYSAQVDIRDDPVVGNVRDFADNIRRNHYRRGKQRLQTRFIPVVPSTLPKYFARYNALLVAPSLDAGYPSKFVPQLCQILQIACVYSHLAAYPGTPLRHVFQASVGALSKFLYSYMENRTAISCGMETQAADSAFVPWLAVFASLPPSTFPPGSPVRSCDSALWHGVEEPLVSVIITHYNRGLITMETLEAIAAQSYPAIEVIVVDDGSTSETVLKELEEHVLPFIRNHGWHFFAINNSYVGAARNRGAERAAGDFLLFLDDDDVPVYHYVARLVQASQQTGAHVVSTFFANFGGDGSSFPPEVYSIWPFYGDALGASLYENTLGGANVFTSRYAFKVVGGFSEIYGVGFEDFEFLTKVNLLGLHHEVVPEPLLFVRASQNSMQATMDSWMSHQRPLSHMMSYFSSNVAEIDMSDALLVAKDLHLFGVERGASIADTFESFSGIQGHFSMFYYGLLHPSGMMCDGNSTANQESCIIDFGDGARKVPLVYNQSAWRVDGADSFYIDRYHMSPGMRGDQFILPVIEWRSRYSGSSSAILEHALPSRNFADGVCVAFFVDGRLYQRLCGPSPQIASPYPHIHDDNRFGVDTGDAEYLNMDGAGTNIPLQLAVGTRIHLVLEPGRDTSCDSMPYRMQIYPD